MSTPGAAPFALVPRLPPRGPRTALADQRVLLVGHGERYASLASALDACRDGDRIDVRAGTYRGDVGVLHAQGVTIRGLGPGAVFEAAGRHALGKGILVVKGDATVENLEFRGARVPDGNGAGIRFDHGRLLVRRCRFVDNEMGLLGSDRPDAELRLVDCVFGDAPRHAGRLHHLLYASTMARLEVQGCRFEGGWRGHLVKSRARQNLIRYNLLRDGPGGGASYELELAEGGDNTVIGNIIVQAPDTQNRSIVAVGYDARPGRDHRLTFAYNTVVNQAWWPARFLRLWDQALPYSGSCTVAHNLFVGRGSIGIPRGSDAGGNRQLPLDALENVTLDRYRPETPCDTPAAAAGPPGLQFQMPQGTGARAADGCPGAVGA